MASGPAESISTAIKAAGTSVAVATNNLSRLQRDVVVEAVNTARRSWWLKRAEDFEKAKPNPIRDFNGSATVEQLRARWVWCHETAQACRNKAALIDMCREDFDAEIAAILDTEEAG